MTEVASLPTHLGFIMDGNRRWAKARGKMPLEGHREGHRAAKRVAEACFEQGIRYVTLYAFSTENWQRAANEVSFLMKRLAIVVSAKEIKYYQENGIRIRFLGLRTNFEPAMQRALQRTEEATRNLTRGTLAICLDYGGQQEIADAARKCVEDGLTADQITTEAISQRIYEPDIPPLDMVVRTSGEQRISNFMLWRIFYSELMFIEKHWPDMTKEDVTAIIEEYSRRSRRFGG